ncbi:MAG: polymer-forming cytoskeletal protein [Acidobacteriota bacterium]
MTDQPSVRRSLEDRVVLCADCDATRTLSQSIFGNLVCSTCGSDNWMHMPVTANVKESVSIRGEITVEEDLTIEGCVEGRIELGDHNLWIGPQGNVAAEICAKSVIIAGRVKGNIFASEMVEIRLSGNVEANIRCPRISIVDGARFEGSIDTGTKTNAIPRTEPGKAKSARMAQGASFGRLLSDPKVQ